VSTLVLSPQADISPTENISQTALEKYIGVLLNEGRWNYRQTRQVLTHFRKYQGVSFDATLMGPLPPTERYSVGRRGLLVAGLERTGRFAPTYLFRVDSNRAEHQAKPLWGQTHRADQYTTRHIPLGNRGREISASHLA
jgi:hypothetical protein